ncbi:GPI mannosyltransferase 3 [Syngnathus typhle]|uniref:GPI mannosyltransferase 3 n=1 Tax=Syngnathus typhle TaxID=161592 RepID=UPI002A69C709|nr:GPI mannosyltransferase 3 [Syngnathus typhle]XP_061132291.1 GPI mannosyltransferase 3 [Syngnathus typhle]
METFRQRMKFRTSKENVKLRKRKSLLYTKEIDTHDRTEVLRVAAFCVLFRALNCFLVQTSFVPDEYWQGVEVAHHMVFNYGHLTWEWKEGIRGFTYPLFFAIIYKVLHWIHCDSVYLLIWMPRLLHALVTAFVDVKFFFFMKTVEDHKTAKLTFFCHLCSWFTWFCCTRTLSNSAETNITYLALCYFPLPGSKTSSSKKYLSLVALAIIVRTTALIVWLPLVAYHFWQDKNKLKLMVHDYIPIGVTAVVISTIIDCIFYEKWVFVQFNFLKLNVFHSVADFYGTHPWHWYLTQGFPVIIGPHLPFFLYGCFLGFRKYKILLVAITWTIGAYSLLPHKEFRFIYPVLPFCFIFCGVAMAHLRAWRRAAAGGLLVSNLLIALYTGLIHQRGALDVMSHVRALCHNVSEADVRFLMPCHSTPYYSHVHCPLKMAFLECPPDLGRVGHVDEADRFYHDPLLWLRTSFPDAQSQPTHLVLFDVLEKEISVFLRDNNFTKTADLFHTHVPEGKVGRRIYIYERY